MAIFRSSSNAKTQQSPVGSAVGNGVGSPMPSHKSGRQSRTTNHSGGCYTTYGNYDEPPILNIIIDPEIGGGGDAIARFTPYVSSPAARSQEFAVAAEEAVREQMESKPGYSPIKRNLSRLKGTFEMFHKAEVQELVFEEEDVKKNTELPYEERAVSTSELSQHCGDHGYIMFVIRRPGTKQIKRMGNVLLFSSTLSDVSKLLTVRLVGCKLCREQALYLKYLFQNYPKAVEGFSLIGIIKGLLDDEESILDFHQNYFPFPLYMDDETTHRFKAVGSRRLKFSQKLKSLNPFLEVSKRMRTKKRMRTQANFQGDGFVQGGVIIFRKDGEPAFKYEEESGMELPVADIALALDEIRCRITSECHTAESSSGSLPDGKEEDLPLQDDKDEGDDEEP
eukprot:scaffold7757_cov68-Cylindrotheca_fusiformis.AAC.1